MGLVVPVGGSQLTLTRAVVSACCRDTSAAVAALMGLIAPLTYAADYRPYFTIHDPDFVALSRWGCKALYDSIACA
jgi:hypothetical protein